VSLRKVVTEITIETNQFLVIKRRQVTRSKCSECASEAEFVRPEPDKVNILVDETGNQHGIEASFSTRHFTGVQTALRRPIRGRYWAQRDLQKDSSTVSDAVANGKARPSKKVKGQKSKGVGKA
jgi:hypothetical protein